MRTLFPSTILSIVATVTVLAPLPAQDQTPKADTQAPAKLDEKRYDHFGAGITEGTAPTAIADMLKTPEKFTTGTVRLTGEITGVCQTKGCWMTLGKQEPPVFVKFKDYGFFMPKDASGRTAIVEGTLTMKQESVEETRHYLEDAGKKEEAAKITEGRKLYHFLAAGVALQKAKKLDEQRYDHFGAGIAEGTAPTAIADMLKTPEKFTTGTVRLTGEITGVCQTKGCWMTLGKQEPPVFVKFKDYGFFMPKDASGRTAIVEGTLTMKQESVEETRHYLEDAGKKEEAAKITEGRKLYHFLAAGVALEKVAK